MTGSEAAILTALEPGEALVPEWKTLKQIGGRKGSTHSIIATRMRLKGWVDRENRGGGDLRPAYHYRITPKGRQALSNHLVTLPARRDKAKAAEAAARARFGVGDLPNEKP